MSNIDDGYGTSLGINAAGTPPVPGLDGGTISASGNVYANNVIATANVIGGNVITQGQLITGGNITTPTTGLTTITSGNFKSANSIIALGDIQGRNITASANIVAANISTAGLFRASGNISGGNLLSSGQISAASTVTAGNLYAKGSGYVSGGQILSAGIVSAAGNIITDGYFIGNVLANNIVLNSITNGNSNVSIPTASGNIGISANGQKWNFDTTGNLTFPTGTKLSNTYGDGTTWLTAGANSYTGLASSLGNQYVQVDDSSVQIGTN